MKIDQLILDHFDSPEDFSKAMELLYESIQAQKEGDSYLDYDENFLSNLEGIDHWHKSKADNFIHRVQKELDETRQKLDKLVETVAKNNSVDGDFKDLLETLKATLNPTYTDEQNPSLKKLFEQWSNEQRGQMRDSSLENTYIPAITLFIRFIREVVGTEPKVTDLTNEVIRRYQGFYKAIPVRTDISKYEINELFLLEGEPKSTNTINQNFGNISTFLNWIELNEYPIKSNLTKLLTKGSSTKSKRSHSNQRKPFTDDELTKLINSDAYIKGNFRTTAMYWSNLIAIFTGARLSEILQLEVTDITQVGDIHVIVIDDSTHSSSDKHKHVKADGSRRSIPIHKQLIKLGFLDYCKAQKGRLFPDEPRNNVGKFDAFTKRHATYRKNVGVTKTHDKELKDFHSYRHTVRTRLSELGTTGPAKGRFDNKITDAIIGHKSKDRGLGEITYNHTDYIEAKSKAINRLNYPSIDFDAIVHWSKISCLREPYRQRIRRKW